MLRFLLSSLLLVSLSASSQNRYIVEFRNKSGTPYTLANPAAYLSTKAVLRRAHQNISIDSTDLPIVPRYIDSVRLAGAVAILNQSKWLNQLAIQTNDAAALTKINSLPFVKAVSQIAFRLAQPVSGIFHDKFIAEKNLPVPSAPIAGRVFGDYYNYGNGTTQVHIHRGEFLHNYGFRGQNMTIAFLDAGFNNYLNNRAFDSVRNRNGVLGTWDFVAGEASVDEDDAHGAACFSTVAANIPGTMVGTAPDANFYLFRTEDAFTEYPIEEQNWAAAAEYADSLGADMITSSLGYYDFDAPQLNHSYADMNGITTIAARAADYAVKKGMIVTNSAGNNGGGPYKYIITPADGRYVLAVGATDPSGNIAGFSAWGPSFDGRVKPDIASVGSGVYVVWTDGNAYPSSGTSFSNPNVNGLIASLWSAFPEVSAADVIDAVKKSSHKYAAPDDRYGYGIPDFKKAFTLLLQKTILITNVTDDQCKAVLKWRSKDDSSFTYILERQLPSQTDFSTIATWKGSTPGFQANAYTYRDTLSGVSGDVYYRVRLNVRSDTSIIVLNKTFAASPCTTPDAVIVSPNPFKDNIGITLNSADAIAKLSIRLVNTRGQVVYRYDGSKPAGTGTYSISTGTLSAGMYVLQLANDGKVFYKKKMLCR